MGEIIRELETIEEYENILQHYSPKVARKILGPKEALQRFLATEWVLLHISGWHHSQIKQVTEYIASNLRQLQKPSQIQSLLHDLRWLKDEMNRLSQETYQAARRADWLKVGDAIWWHCPYTN